MTIRTSAAFAVATRDPRTGEVSVFAVNRHASAALPLRLRVEGNRRLRLLEHSVLCDPDPQAANTADQPDRLVPRAAAGTRADGATLSAVVPPLSWNLIRLAEVG